MNSLAHRLCIGLLALGAFWALGLLSPVELGKSGVLMTACILGLVGFLSKAGRRASLMSGLSISIYLLFSLDAAIKGFLRTFFGLRPNHSMVLQAVFNTDAGEASEFMVQNWRAIAQTSAIFLVILCAAIAAERYLSRRERGIPLAPPSRKVRFSVHAMLLLFVTLHFNKTMAKENPVLFWPLRYAAYKAQLAEMAAMQDAIRRNLAHQEEWKVRYQGEPQRTVVWVIGESTNRTNMSLYGYPRHTTPQLDAMRDQLVVFNDVISADASTVPSMMKMLTPATLAQPDGWNNKPDVLALAKAAGYKTFWLSNQTMNDGWIGVVSSQADERQFINHGSGRGENNYDANLLPYVDKALADPAPRKLIVVHLLGAHPTYKSRYPAQFARFDGAADTVAATMDRLGRQFWIKWQRDAYDNAIFYNDYVVGGILQRITQGASSENTALIYAADHGQEVGHYRNHAGHSPIDKSGYEIPMIVWDKSLARPDSPARASLENRPYQTDQLEHTVLGLLKVDTIYYDARHDILASRFEPAFRSINGKPYSTGIHLAAAKPAN